MKPEAPIFFVCGTPIERHGFECKELDDRRLPNWSRPYLDTLPPQKLPTRGEATHYFCRVESEDPRVAIYAEYRWIQPNDTERNRGAFMAVGCWSEAPLSATHAMAALLRIEAVHTDLRDKRNPDTDSFLPEFQLRSYTAPNGSIESSQVQLSELYRQAAAGVGAYEGKTGSLFLTAAEIRQGSLAEWTTGTSDQQPSPPAAPVNISRGTAFSEAIQEAMSEVPQTRRVLRKLLSLEEQRTKLLRSLGPIVKVTSQGSGSRARTPASGARYTHTMASRMSIAARVTNREIVFSAIGMGIVIVMMLLVFLVLILVGE